jgi:hypothetical protein
LKKKKKNLNRRWAESGPQGDPHMGHLARPFWPRWQVYMPWHGTVAQPPASFRR